MRGDTQSAFCLYYVSTTTSTISLVNVSQNNLPLLLSARRRPPGVLEADALIHGVWHLTPESG